MALIDFRTDLQGIVVEKLVHLGYSPISGEYLNTLLTRYINIQGRMPSVICWNIKKSKELIAKALSTEISNGLQQFIQKAESGEDLKPHISTRISNPDYTDLMFYDWGVFHFHLGINPHPTLQGFLERTDELLFSIAHADSETMYLIDIHSHKGGFTNSDLLRIIEDNWPQLLEPYTVPSEGILFDNPSDNEIGQFRKARVVVPLQTPGGRVLFPMGGGITTAGTSVINQLEADRIRNFVAQFEGWFIQQKETLAPYFKDKYQKNWNELQFKLEFLEEVELLMRIKELTSSQVLYCSFDGQQYSVKFT